MVTADGGDGPRTEALLVLFDSDDAQQGVPARTWVIIRELTTIGRNEDNDVALPDRWISRHHAQIRRQDAQPPGRDRYAIEDMGSKNGLFVNGARVRETVLLQDGDQIQISPRFSLTFVDNEATAPLYQNQAGVVVDVKTRTVWVMGQELKPPLSGAQFALLQALTNAPGRVFAPAELVPIVWPDQNPAGITDEALSSLVRRLRKRLMGVDDRYRYIIAVRGHGFKYERPAPQT